MSSNKDNGHPNDARNMMIVITVVLVGVLVFTMGNSTVDAVHDFIFPSSESKVEQAEKAFEVDGVFFESPVDLDVPISITNYDPAMFADSKCLILTAKITGKINLFADKNECVVLLIPYAEYDHMCHPIVDGGCTIL